MPEGPEIRRAADRLGKALIGKKSYNVGYPMLPLQARTFD
jgi:formamidopyrimidine-DNA glycosylase